MYQQLRQLRQLWCAFSEVSKEWKEWSVFVFVLTCSGRREKIASFFLFPSSHIAAQSVQVLEDKGIRSRWGKKINPYPDTWSREEFYKNSPALEYITYIEFGPSLANSRNRFVSYNYILFCLALLSHYYYYYYYYILTWNKAIDESSSCHHHRLSHLLFCLWWSQFSLSPQGKREGSLHEMAPNSTWLNKASHPRTPTAWTLTNMSSAS